MIRDTKYFRFGPVRQERGAKHVRYGDLLEAVNVKQTAKAGVYAKRGGFVRTAQSYSGGSLSGTPSVVLPGTNDATLMRDTGDQLWSRAASSNTWAYTGDHLRPWPTSAIVQTNAYTAPQPFSVMVGANLWVFALASNAYNFTIIEAATGVQVQAMTTIAATNIVHASAAYDGSYVWLFYVENQTGANKGRIMCHKLNPASPSSAPTITTYYTLPAAPVDVSGIRLQQVQARYFSSAAQVFVCAVGGQSDGGGPPVYKRAACHSVLNPATGLAVVAGGQAAACSVAYSGASGERYMGGLAILDGQDGSGTYWYYALHGCVDTDFAQNKVVICKVTAATFSTCPLTVLENDGVGTGWVRQSIGCVDGSNIVVMTTSIAAFNFFGLAPADIQYRTNLAHVTGSTVTEVHGVGATGANSIYGGWVASTLIKIGARWYFVTGFDDYGFCGTTVFTEANTLQRSYQIRELSIGGSAAACNTRILGQFEMSDGPAIFHRNVSAITNAALYPATTCVCPIYPVSGTSNAIAALGRRSITTGYVDIETATIETAKTYGKPIQSMSRGICPGNIPVAWDGRGVHEVAPLTAPYFVYFSGGAVADYVGAAACYAIYDQDGVVWRSAPKVISQNMQVGGTLYVPVGRQRLGGSSVYGTGTTSLKVEIYIGTTSTLKLQAVYDAPISSAAISHTLPAVAAMVNGPILYTNGNALSQTWPVACQAVADWQNRILMANRNRVWVSKELEEGFGPLFNEVQTSLWADVDSDINAMAPVDNNYLALLANSGAAVFSGNGPDGVGNGNYTVNTLQTRKGIVAGGIAAQGPYGCYFQDSQTSRICVVTPGLQVVEAAGGAYDYSAYTITSIAWHEAENLLLLISGGSLAAIAIDYNHPDEAAPGGQCYLWTFAAGFTPTVACRDSSGLLVLSSGAHVYRQSTTQWVDDKAGGTDTYRMKLATAELQVSDLQGQFSLEKLQVLLAMRAASGVEIGVYPGYASATGADSRITTVSIDLPTPTNSGDTESVLTRPAYCARIQSFRVVVQEKAAIATQSFEFDGLAAEYTALGRMLRPAETRVI